MSIIIKAHLSKSEDSHMVSAGILKVNFKVSINKKWNSKIIMTDYDIPLTEIVAKRTIALLEYYSAQKRVQDCHFLWWSIGTGTFDIGWGIPNEETLSMYELERIWNTKLIDIHSNQKHLEYRLFQLGSSMWNIVFPDLNETSRQKEIKRIKKELHWLPPINQKDRYQLHCTFEKWTSLECGDLCLMRQGKHSMIFLWKWKDEESLFLSRIWSGGDLWIHTIEQIFKYYLADTIEIWRSKENNTQKNTSPVIQQYVTHGYCSKFYF
jgi:hypothetical protein